jgi:hypothetical protein
MGIPVRPRSLVGLGAGIMSNSRISPQTRRAGGAAMRIGLAATIVVGLW